MDNKPKLTFHRAVPPPNSPPPLTPEATSPDLETPPPLPVRVLAPEPAALPCCPPPQVTSAVEVDGLTRRQLNGASWFFWVAGLSLVNSIILATGGEWGFLFGMGITQFITGIAQGFAENAPDAAPVIHGVAIGLNALILVCVVVLGLFARKRWVSAFVVGAILYCGDGLLSLIGADFLGAAFHGWVLFWLINGAVATRQLNKLGVPR